MSNPVTEIPTPVAVGPGTQPQANANEIFPTYIPEPEKMIWQALNDAANTGIAIPEEIEAQGIFLPSDFGEAPDIALFAGRDSTYEEVVGNKVQPIPIVRGWPTYQAKVPMIGVATTTDNEDGSERLGQGGFAGDVYAQTESGTITATAAYYAEPLYSVIVAELIHENRDERDRLHNMIRRRLYPLRHQLPSTYSQVKEIFVQSEKQDLPLDEQPLTLYVSIFTVEAWTEALIPTTIVTGAAITAPIEVKVEIEETQVPG